MKIKLNQIFRKKFSKQTHFLNFLGRGSCFAKDHVAAYFITPDNDFVLIDCSEHTYQRLKNEFDLSAYKNVYVYITHTHGDHVGGLGVLVQYCYFALKKHVIVIAPSIEVSDDIKTLFKIEGVEDSMYTLTYAFGIPESLTKQPNYPIPNSAYAVSILTPHVPPLEGKCFGYHFNLGNITFVYTGDTASLEPFIPFLTKGSELYVDTSVAYKSDVHLWFEDMLPTLIQLTEQGISVYLMHLDDAKKAEKLVKKIPGIEVVQNV